MKGTGVHYPKYGPVVTAGGLIFTGTRDKKVRALDEETGKVIWETETPEGMEGIPAVYESGGREYIVFCASAQSDVGTTTPVQNGAYVAFSLKEK
jgi:quinoprotein glucose dehydrogenase